MAFLVIRLIFRVFRTAAPEKPPPEGAIAGLRGTVRSSTRQF